MTELRLPALGRHRVEAVSAALFRLGVVGVQEDWMPGEAPEPKQPWDDGPPRPEPNRVVLITWFAEEPDRDHVARTLRKLTGPVIPQWATTPEVDYEQAFHDHFPPIVVSDRLTVAAPWNAPPGALIVEPGQGFGTGHHTTTRQALQALDALTPDGHPLRTAVDVGCGSGILALAAARRGLRVVGVDVEEAAVREAIQNAARNGLTAEFRADPVSTVDGPVDLVLANLHAELVRELGPELVRLTGGHLVIAGILAEREPIARAALEPALRRVSAVEEEGWICAIYARGPA